MSDGGCLMPPLRVGKEEVEGDGRACVDGIVGGDMVGGGCVLRPLPAFWKRCDSRRLRECRMRVSSAPGSMRDCLHNQDSE